MPTSRAAVLLFLCLLAAPGISSRAQDAASPTPAPLSPQAGNDLLHQIDEASTSVFEKVAPAVVIIKADKKPTADDPDQTFDFNFHSPDGGQGSMPAPYARSEGSGFIVRADGYIYTNYHVVEDTDKIAVILRDNRRFIARLVGVDERTDIAVLKIDATGLPTVSFLDSDAVRVGQMCFAIGIPYNLDYSFCRGIVSGKGRGNLMSTDAEPLYEDYIQTDAFINPGNSGGPLFDIDGRVMGMITAINGIGRGLAFAITSNMLNDVGGTLIATGHITHPWLGIEVKSLDKEIDEDPSAASRYEGLASGVCVDSIEANAPAFKSDLRPKDIITKVDGVPVLNPNDLQREILHKKIGQNVTLSVWRAGKSFDLPIVTDSLPPNLAGVVQSPARETAANPLPDATYGIEFIPAKGQPEAVPGNAHAGALISAIIFDSPAQRAGLNPGDIITEVDHQSVSGISSCIDLLSAHSSASGPEITYIRKGEKGHATLSTGDVDNVGKP